MVRKVKGKRKESEQNEGSKELPEENSQQPQRIPR